MCTCTVPSSSQYLSHAGSIMMVMIHDDDDDDRVPLLLFCKKKVVHRESICNCLTVSCQWFDIKYHGLTQ